ncbi:MAG: hypothetical protein GYA63_10565 [Armatimonadetes bacterium]|nr:hypothetical protein [Armatimonadota bacterium]
MATLLHDIGAGGESLRCDAEEGFTAGSSELSSDVRFQRRGILNKMRGLQFEITDVPQSTLVAEFGSEVWCSRFAESQESLIAIGSARACLASELMLASMFTVRPFPKPALGFKEPPFFFIWSPNACCRFASAFSLSHEDMADRKLAKRIRDNKSWVLQVGEARHEVS